MQDKAARANKEKASLLTSIQLLFKDLEFTQLIKVINPETVHDKQQAVLGRYSDSNGTISHQFITI